MKTSILLTAAILVSLLACWPGQTIAILGILLLAGMALAGRVP